MSTTEFKQIERIIRILQRLALRGETTVRELYGYFEGQVPKRTLQRDLVGLSSANIPLMTRRGEGRELIWYLDSSFLRFIPETLGNQELLASFFLQRLSAVAKGTKLEKSIESLLRKSRQLVSPEVFQSYEGQGLSQNLFGATFTGYIDYAPHSETIDCILNAASTNRRCTFVYRRSWKAEVSRFEADPYMILYHKGALYAVVHVPKHDNYIFLPIQRIRGIHLTSTKFIRDRSFSLDSIRKHRFGIFGHENLKPQRIALRFGSDIADIVAERIWHPTQKITRHKDGSLTLKMTTVVSDELRSWVASWMGYVEVVAPKDLTRGLSK